MDKWVAVWSGGNWDSLLILVECSSQASLQKRGKSYFSMFKNTAYPFTFTEPKHIKTAVLMNLKM